VETLRHNLYWFDNGPEATVIRNRPVQERKLSDQALRDAGMKPRITDLPNHAQNTKARSARELLQQAAKNILASLPEELRNPWKVRCESMVVQGRGGQIDGYLTQDLRKVFAKDATTKTRLITERAWNFVQEVRLGKVHENR
jgi:hypothetical protein